MIEEVLELLPKQAVITKDEFVEWKHHPVTKQLKVDLLAALLDELSYSLPSDSIDLTVIAAHQRQGAIDMLTIVNDWIPLSVRRLDEEKEEVLQ